MRPRLPVQVRRRQVASRRDSHGNDVGGWSQPEVVLAFGWAPVSSSEPVTVGANRVVVDLQVAAPVDLSERDRVVIGGEEFEVQGRAEDWNHGPFRAPVPPRYVWNLRRVDG